MKHFRGKVVSDKMKKTIIVEVTRLKKHPKYERRFKVTKRYKVHDPENKHKIGEIIDIAETRPVSKDKKWRVLD